MEIQRTPISQNSWKEKWKVAESFFERNLPIVYKNWQLTKEMSILVLSEQTSATVQQSTLAIQAYRQIDEVFEVNTEQTLQKNVQVILHQLNQDIQLSKKIYQNWQQEQASQLVPPLSMPALRIYEKLLHDK